MFTRHRIEPGTRFIQNQDPIPGHQRSTDQNTLSLALREEGPWSVGQIGALHLKEVPPRLTKQRPFCRMPEIKLRVAPARDHVQLRLLVLDPVTNPGADKTHFFPKLTPVRLAILLPQNFDSSSGWLHILRQ